MESMLKALKPFIKLFQFIGLSPFVVTEHGDLMEASVTTIYSIVSISVFLASFIYGFFQEDLFSIPNDQPMNEIAHTVDFIQLTGIRFTHLIILFEGLVRRRRLMQLLCKLSDWDLIVQKYYNNLHISHETIRRKILLKLLASGTFYGGIQLILLLIILLRQQYEFTYYWSLYLVSFIVCSLRYVQIYILISLLKDRFHLINKKIEKLNLNEGTASSGNVLMTKNATIINDELSAVQQLIILRQLYDKLWELTSLTNKCFGLSLLVNIGNDFIAITGHCYWIFLTMENPPVGVNDILAVIGSTIWTIPSLVNSFMMASICHVTMEEANEAGSLLHQIKHDCLNESQNMVVQQFSLQLLHQKVKFTAYGFFNIDFSLLFTMISATTTYLVIIIQMHNSA
ncbi:putative gustatory receptor 2a [Culicoides brevitarsis]|uniref:putative gustatory receptor 2a n=1 Tax=Culicoides brevitarsis TaxID=469753 RepID=UPI00307BCA76